MTNKAIDKVRVWIGCGAKEKDFDQEIHTNDVLFKYKNGKIGLGDSLEKVEIAKGAWETEDTLKDFELGGELRFSRSSH